MENGVTNIVNRISDDEAFDLNNQYGTHNYHPLPVNMVRARGARAWDGSGKEYIDCIGAYSAVAHGHLSEFVVETIKAQLEKVALVSRAMYSTELGLMLKGLTEYCDLEMACIMNSGAEANETAIKLARKWAYTKKGIPDGKAEILVADGNFHGRTTTIIGFSTEEQYRRHFGPFTPGFKVIPFGDIEAVKANIHENTAAVFMEPIQAEAGIRFPPDGYLAELRALCTQENVLLIWDEVQTGFCRTGKRFAWQHEDAKPDLMAVGKPLGGGVFPVSAAIGRKDVMNVFVPGDHGSTFGGNPLGCVIALAALAEMETKDLAGKSAKLGARLKEGLEGLDHDCILEVRGRGLLIGLEVDTTIDDKKLGTAFLDQGLLTKETRHRTFRFAPPLIIDEAIVDEVVDRVDRAIKSV